MKIRFDSNDNDLPLAKILSIPILSIVAKSFFSKLKQILATNSYT